MSPAPGPSPWTVLDTCFTSSDRWLECVRSRRASGAKTTHLHYVAIAGLQDRPYLEAPSPTNNALLPPGLPAFLAGALPGFQRFLLDQGQSSLTLCVGSLKDMLSAQQFHADEISIAADPTLWDHWKIQLMTRRCKRGTLLTLVAPESAPVQSLEFKNVLERQGFRWLSRSSAVFDPVWELRTTRKPPARHRPTAARCAVVGGGLAGAAVADAMARRGWSVTVLDTHAHCAGGASGLPVGVIAPHLSIDDSPRSRLSRAGVLLTLQHAKAHLNPDVDWSRRGVLEIHAHAQQQLRAAPHLTQSGWLAPGRRPELLAETRANPDSEDNTLFHLQAGWVRPAKLVEAWLSQPGVTWLGGKEVKRLVQERGVWTVVGLNDEPLADAEVVVLANAIGAATLCEALPPELQPSDAVRRQLGLLHAVHGTVSHGAWEPGSEDRFPACPVNGAGSFVQVGCAPNARWYAGAGYERELARALDLPHQHTANLHRLEQLLPSVAARLRPAFDAGCVDSWTGSRCVSHDRLPLVGPTEANAHSGLWLSIAMGSRGLSFAALCAELLAARLGGEPLPIEANLASHMDAQRQTRATE